MMKKIFLLFIYIVLFTFVLSACTTIKPYQRTILSKKEMQFDSEPVSTAAREHLLNSLEGSTGGFGTGGGGCGCN